jgi:hypothetical protein
MAGIYVLTDPATGFTKVGRASDLDTRLANLKTANPRLQLVHWYETNDASLVESYVHAKLVNSRKEGEFFDVSPEVVNAQVIDFLDRLAYRPEDSSLEAVRQLEALEAERDPTLDELALIQKIVDLRGKLKTLEVEEQIYSEQLMVSVGQASGLTGWATFNGAQTTRFDGQKFKLEQPDLAQQYLKTSYTRSLRVRPGMA